MEFLFRNAVAEDLASLLALENQCFEHDRLSPRSFQWMIKRAHASLIVAQYQGRVMGYALLLFHRGTSLARLYSIAIAPDARGHGLGKRLLAEAEQKARDHDCAYLRLEVRTDNAAAIHLYEGAGYRRFAQVDDYYEDHAQALRYEKRIIERQLDDSRLVPYYQQTTEFTCGPACLMMAMAALQPGRFLGRLEEVQLWREATTIFMTSGHGGCSPQGLALAAFRRGFRVRLQVSIQGPLFLNGVRRESKRDVMRLVHEAFCAELQRSDVEQLSSSPFDMPQLLAAGGQPLVLISNYRLTRTKAPHWVLVTGCDEDFVYLHDPDIDHSRHRQALDCQNVPVSHGQFQRMRVFGGSKLRAAVVLFHREASTRQRGE
ncbi:GNAT family N-acetyltransferase/peptidase C39 family protein [Pseudomonas sp. LS44]|uniref:GNAT family N-acetyltransferase/peptidase C39 family protein n=1 Tax=Pseudomonas sp. LS44 TaxID=1357074 RepID=UPI00215AB6FA|nr:GNAT family N-acetyltransferase/peptidase C39 family protein [Pseudomonas sp. LS44]UVE18356.1 GNAT family N-acetyltransferase/peptidase C39 family protein [Pseudomonas sp. LS44]